jgi:hypothetical protein
VISLSAQDEPKGFCDREGVDDYVRKPYDFRALETAISRVRSRGVRGFAPISSAG